MRFLLLYSFSAICTLGCGPDGYSPPSWTPVDPVQVESELFSDLDPAGPDTLLQALEHLTGEDAGNTVHGYLQGLLQGLNEGTDKSADNSSETWGERTGALQNGGAALWVRFSCPGPALETPITDFSSGMIQLDGPSMNWGEGHVTAARDIPLQMCLGTPSNTRRVTAFFSEDDGLAHSDRSGRHRSRRTEGSLCPLFFRMGFYTTPPTGATAFVMGAPRPFGSLSARNL